MFANYGTNNFEIDGFFDMHLNNGYFFDSNIFSLAVLIHAHAANCCSDGTNANSVVKSLAEVVKNIQKQKVRFDTFRRLK